MATGSVSKVRRITRCKRKVYYSDILEIQRKRQSIAPNKGRLIHDCLQNKYEGKDPYDPIRNFEVDMDKVFDEEREEWTKLKDVVYRIVRGYNRAYKSADSNIKTIATEFKFEFKLGKHTFMGYIDWIYEDDAGIWVSDHKTTTRLPDPGDLYLDYQLFMYYAATKLDPNLKELLGGKDVQGIVFNHIKSKAPKQPRILKSGKISKAKINSDIATYFGVVKSHGFDVEEYKDMIPKLKGNVFYRRTKIPIDEGILSNLLIETDNNLTRLDNMKKQFDESNLYDESTIVAHCPRTLLKNRCEWDCEYYDLCVSSMAGRNVNDLLDLEYEPRQSRSDDKDTEED